MDAFLGLGLGLGLGWVTGVVSDLLHWVVGIRGADVMEGDGQSRPQVMDFGLVLLRFLMICGGQGMFPHYMDERYFALDFYPWSCDLIDGVTLGAGQAEEHRSYLCIMWIGGGWILAFLWWLAWGTMRKLGLWVLGHFERYGIVCFCLRLLSIFFFIRCLALACISLRMVARSEFLHSRGLVMDK
jgi:hypothetical protein